MILYHGSKTEIQRPAYDTGASGNDNRQGFHMTRSPALGREWAVLENTDGCLNKYSLDTRGLKVLNLKDGKHTILHWLCMVLASRDADITSEVMDENMEYLKARFSLDMSHYDCITGWPADDINFSLAMDFMSSGLAYETLCRAIHLGDRDMQYVLVSPKAFEQISFHGSEPVCSALWYPKKMARESKAAAAYDRIRQQAKKPSQGLYMTDIVRQEMDANDPGLYL